MTMSLRTMAGRSCAIFGQGLPAVAGHVHDVAPALQQLLQPQPLRRIVFHNQQPLAGAFLHW